jgi:hypothetical protein
MIKGKEESGWETMICCTYSSEFQLELLVKWRAGRGRGYYSTVVTFNFCSFDLWKYELFQMIIFTGRRDPVIKQTLYITLFFYAPKKNCDYLFYPESEKTASPRNGSKNLKFLRYHDLENCCLNLKKCRISLLYWIRIQKLILAWR